MAGEPVRIYFRGKKIKTGTAWKSGSYAYKFKVGKKTGKAVVSVYGAFNNRKGQKAFKVVK